jgi:hypothetical protein
MDEYSANVIRNIGLDTFKSTNAVMMIPIGRTRFTIIVLKTPLLFSFIFRGVQVQKHIAGMAQVIRVKQKVGETVDIFIIVWLIAVIQGSLKAIQVLKDINSLKTPKHQ